MKLYMKYRYYLGNANWAMKYEISQTLGVDFGLEVSSRLGTTLPSAWQHVGRLDVSLQEHTK